MKSSVGLTIDMSEASFSCLSGANTWELLVSLTLKPVETMPLTIDSWDCNTEALVVDLFSDSIEDIDFEYSTILSVFGTSLPLSTNEILFFLDLEQRQEYKQMPIRITTIMTITTAIKI